MSLRDYQNNIKNRIVQTTASPVLAVLPTGGGKSRTAAYINLTARGRRLIVAHRQELVCQLSYALAQVGAWHQVIAPDSVISYVAGYQSSRLRQAYVIPGAPSLVAGIDTILRREIDLSDVTLWQIDEGHHVLPTNKWGALMQMMPSAFGIGWTATPHRTDRRGLGEIYRSMIEGPTTRQLCGMGYLSPIRVFAPPPAIARDLISVSAKTGEFTQQGLATAMRMSPIVGDVVREYQRLAYGQPGLVFAANAEMAEKHLEAFKRNGIPSELITWKTSGEQRDGCLERLASGRTWIIVNIDMFGEGTDVPEVRYIGCARATESLSLWRQMCGRVMRPAQGKDFGIICDHVGNTLRHGMPDCDYGWSLEGRRKNENSGSQIRVTTCGACFFAFDGGEKMCPYCGWVPEPRQAISPAEVEGDLTEYSEALVQKLLGEARKAIAPAPKRKPFNVGEMMTFRRMDARRTAQIKLREKIESWLNRNGQSSSSYRQFYQRYGIDVLTAQTLGGPDAERLCAEIGD